LRAFTAGFVVDAFFRFTQGFILTVSIYTVYRKVWLFTMRLDKYLKVSRIIKRRTIANEACDAGRVMVNGKVAKASQDVKVGDIIKVGFGNKEVKAEVLSIQESVKKEDARDMVRFL